MPRKSHRLATRKDRGSRWERDSDFIMEFPVDVLDHEASLDMSETVNQLTDADFEPEPSTSPSKIIHLEKKAVVKSNKLNLAHTAVPECIDYGIGGLKYKCSRCFKCFQDLDHFRKHVVQFGSDVFPCTYCEVTLSSLCDVVVHEQHHANMDLWCYACEVRFRRAEDTKIHHTMCTNNIMKITTTMYNYIATQEEAQGLMYGAEELVVQVKNITEPEQRSRGIQMVFKAGDDLPYACSHCGLKFEHEDLKRHIEKKHCLGKQCPVCHKRFLDNQAMRIHLRRHQNDKTLCDGCQQKFDPGSYLVHADTCQKLQAIMKCPFCPFTTNNNHGLVSHVTGCELPPSGKFMVFCCSKCQFSSSDSSVFRSHYLSRIITGLCDGSAPTTSQFRAPPAKRVRTEVPPAVLEPNPPPAVIKAASSDLVFLNVDSYGNLELTSNEVSVQDSQPDANYFLDGSGTLISNNSMAPASSPMNIMASPPYTIGGSAPQPKVKMVSKLIAAVNNSPPLTFDCENCGKIYSSKKNLNEHMAIDCSSLKSKRTVAALFVEQTRKRSVFQPCDRYTLNNVQDATIIPSASAMGGTFACIWCRKELLSVSRVNSHARTCKGMPSVRSLFIQCTRCKQIMRGLTEYCEHPDQCEKGVDEDSESVVPTDFIEVKNELIE